MFFVSLPFVPLRVRGPCQQPSFLLISHQPCCPCAGSVVSVQSLTLSNRHPKVSGNRASAMSKTTSHQDVSVLSSAKNGLTYLTPNDWALIADKAARLQ